MFHGQLLPVVLTDERDMPAETVEASLKAEVSPSAHKAHNSRIIIRIFPRLVPAESIPSGGSSPPPLHPEQHGTDKCMERRFSKLVFSVNNLYSIFQIKMFLRKLTEIFQIKLCNFHTLPPLIPHDLFFRRASSPSQSA